MENNENELVITAEDLEMVINATENPDKEVLENNKRFYQALIQAIFVHKISIDNMDVSKLREAVADVLCTLSPRERDVLRIRLGMDDGRMRTLEEVGQLFGVTRERIRQVEGKALRKLRHPNRSKYLRQLIEAEIGKSIYDL